MKKLLLFFIAVLVSASSTAQVRPQRVVILVLDQMRADYIDHYDLPNLKALREESVDFINANVGHYPSVTLISHPAIATGVFPKHFGINNYLYEDKRGDFGKPGLWYDAGQFNVDQFRKIFAQNLKTPTAMALLKKKLGGLAIAVGEKNYAAITFGGLDSDQVITLSGKIKEGPWKDWRGPAGFKVPTYIAAPEGNRFFIDSREKYGTENEILSLDGNHYMPGNDPNHLGGDVWTADVALTVMEKEPQWRLFLITMAAIDKIGHVFAEMDSPQVEKKKKTKPYNLEKILKTTDAQVGRLVAHLKAKNLWDKTLFVVTADHGGISTAKHFYGDRTPGAVETNCSYGVLADKEFLKPPKAAKRWLNPAYVDHAFSNTASSIWLAPAAKQDIDKTCRFFSKMPGAVAVYAKENRNNDWDYHLCTSYRGSKLPSFLDPTMLLNTMASDSSPDLVVQLGDETGYAVLGDHGGLQEKSLRIPMLMHIPGSAPQKNACPIRLVDILPIVMQQTGIVLPQWLDGNAECIK